MGAPACPLCPKDVRRESPCGALRLFAGHQSGLHGLFGPPVEEEGRGGQRGRGGRSMPALECFVLSFVFPLLFLGAFLSFWRTWGEGDQGGLL